MRRPRGGNVHPPLLESLQLYEKSKIADWNGQPIEFATRNRAVRIARARIHSMSDRRLIDFGIRLHNLLRGLPDDRAITDTLDYAIGALHGLAKAIDLKFVDRSGESDRTYRPFLAQYVLSIAELKPVHSTWLAGFYFNSAIQRIAACYDRIPKLLGAEEKKGGDAGSRMDKVNGAKREDHKRVEHWKNVYEEFNPFKHSPEGKASGRGIGLEDALSAFDELLRLVESKRERLNEAYGGTKQRE